MTRNFDGAGNYYNKYESRNPFIRFLIRNYLDDLKITISPFIDDFGEALEVGCGEGYITDYLAGLGIPIEGSDVSERIIGIARMLHPSVEFFSQSVYDITASGKSYDVIFANQVLEHLDDPGRGVSEMKKATRKYLVFSVPNEPLFRIANLARMKYLKDLGNPPGHHNHWSKHQFKRFLMKNGLEVLTISTSSIWTIAICLVHLNDKAP